MVQSLEGNNTDIGDKEDVISSHPIMQMIVKQIKQHLEVASHEFDNNYQSGDKLSLVGNLYTGYEISHGIQRFINAMGPKPKDVKYTLPLLIILFVGKCHTDLFGSLTITPVLFTTFAMYSIKFLGWYSTGEALPFFWKSSAKLTILILRVWNHLKDGV